MEDPYGLRTHCHRRSTTKCGLRTKAKKRLLEEEFGNTRTTPGNQVSGMAHHAPVTVDTSHDPLARMRVFELATALGPDCFEDAQALIANPITKEIAGQLYAAVGSIAA